MSDTSAIDLSKLPCPVGCRWEVIYGDVYYLMVGNVPFANVRKIGREWTWRVFKGGGYDHDADDFMDAVKHICKEIGLSPAPAGRTFTEADLRLVMRDAWTRGFKQGEATCQPTFYGGISMDEIMDSDIDAALAAATDRKEAQG